MLLLLNSLNILISCSIVAFWLQEHYFGSCDADRLLGVFLILTQFLISGVVIPERSGTFQLLCEFRYKLHFLLYVASLFSREWICHSLPVRYTNLRFPQGQRAEERCWFYIQPFHRSLTVFMLQWETNNLKELHEKLKKLSGLRINQAVKFKQE